MKFRAKYLLVGAFLAMAPAGFFPACASTIPIEEQNSFCVKLQTSNATKAKGVCWVEVVASGQWTLDFESATPWARINANAGTGCKSNISLSWDRNSSDSSRTCTLVLTAGSRQARATFSQRGEGIESDVPGFWMELPALDDPALTFHTLPMVIDGKTYRNYSFYWDRTNLVSRWVAYPLNSKLLTGSSGRSEAWVERAVFEGIPEKYQPNLSTYYQNSSGYVRGHQIPSADRQILEYNKDTYYGINMTPQYSSFNSGTWANCEAYVREKSRSVDTLYVVTGCVAEPNIGYSYDCEGKRISRPSAYFKALLAYSKTRTVGASTGGYAGIAFHYANEKYTGGSFINAAISIDKLEEITGIDFFVNLPSVIGAAKAADVERTTESWWFN